MDEEQEKFYPELSEKGIEEAQKLTEAFKKKLSKAADEVISDFYCDLPDYIESDSWTNFRQSIVSGLSDYRNKDKYPYDFARIRKAIYEESKEEIIKDLNQDLLKEIESLKQSLEWAREHARH